MELDVTSDIYADLGHNELGDNYLSKEIERLEVQNNLLEEHIYSLESDVEKLCSNITDMKKVQNNLAKNISELFKTAKAEIARKDRVIKELRSELERLKLKETSCDRGKDCKLNLNLHRNDGAKLIRPPNDGRKRSYHSQRRSRSRSESREKHVRHFREEYGDSSKRARHGGNCEGNKSEYRREPHLSRETTDNCVKIKDGNKTLKDQTKRPSNMRDKTKNRLSQENENAMKPVTKKTSNEPENDDVALDKPVTMIEAMDSYKKQCNESMKKDDTLRRNLEGLIQSKEKTDNKIRLDNVTENGDKKTRENETVETDVLTGIMPNTDGKDKTKEVKEENTNKSENTNEFEGKKEVTDVNTNKDAAQAKMMQNGVKNEKIKPMTKNYKNIIETNKEENQQSVADICLEKKVTKGKSIEQVSIAIKGQHVRKKHITDKSNDPTTCLSESKNNLVVGVDMFKQGEKNDCLDQDEKSTITMPQERKQFNKMIESKEINKQDVSTVAPNREETAAISKDKQANSCQEKDENEEVEYKPSKKVEAEATSRVLRSTTRRKSVRQGENINLVATPEKGKKTGITHLPRSDSKVDFVSMNLTHNGEIPVLHLIEDGDKISTSTSKCENLTLATASSSSPISSANAFKQLAEDLSLSSASNVEDTPEKEQRPRPDAAKQNLSFENNPLNTTTNLPKVSDVASTRKRRRVVFTMMD